MTDLITLSEILGAREKLPADLRRTPFLPLARTAEELGHEALFLKLENLQVTGAYKPRAAFHILQSLTAGERKRGVVMPSSGNFAQGFAFAGSRLGAKVIVVMPENTSPLKVKATRGYGAEVVLCENDYSKRQPVVEEVARERGMIPIHIGTDRRVPIGHAGVGLEILEDLPTVDTIIVPVSSGGLISGLASAVKLQRPSVRVIGAQPAGAPAMYRSLQAGEPVKLDEWHTMADALTATQIYPFLFEHVKSRVDDLVLVSEEEIAVAFRLLVLQGKIMPEPAGAVAVAAFLSGKVKAAGQVVAVVSGGNVRPQLAARLLGEAD